MTTTDQQILDQVQSHLIETQDSGATWSSSFWTATEVIEYMNSRQYLFLKETGLLLTAAQIVTIPNQLRHSLPQDWIATADAAFKSSDSPPVYSELARSDEFELDEAIPSWQVEQATTPLVYTEGELPTLEIQIAPAPLQGGVILLLYVALSSLLSNTGQTFTVPDDFVPTIKWGMMGDMLEKVGRAQDLKRAAYCEGRYREGVEAAILMLKGFSA